MKSMKRMVRSFAFATLFLMIVCAVMAEELRSFHGRVVNINGLIMAFVPDVGGNAFDVDLTRIDQTAYAFLKSGDAITVVGVMTPDGNRLIAVSITPDQ
jgi:hypothetical protein